MDGLLVAFLKFFVGLVGRLPSALAVKLLTALLRTLFFFLPKYGRIAECNLKLAFPTLGKGERRRLWRKSLQSLARLLVDACRMHRLTPEWVAAHVQCPFLQRYRELKQQHGGRGVLIATGHLGSFELLAHSMPMFGHKIAFVVRNFQLKKVDDWWTGMREAYGNRVINRKGAFQDVVRLLKEGTDVAILFDQNVRDRHAVFVDWFGMPAATTKTLGLAALKTEAPIVVASIAYRGAGRYEVVAEECPVQDIYRAEEMPQEEKVREITARTSGIFEKMIRTCPEEWFWMHRRWRTRPAGDTKNPYADNRV